MAHCNRSSAVGTYGCPMNALVMALVLTALVVLDYVWEFLPKKAENARRLTVLKALVVALLFLFGCPCLRGSKVRMLRRRYEPAL